MRQTAANNDMRDQEEEFKARLKRARRRETQGIMKVYKDYEFGISTLPYVHICTSEIVLGVGSLVLI